jgi:hypothetical protein
MRTIATVLLLGVSATANAANDIDPAAMFPTPVTPDA